MAKQPSPCVQELLEKAGKGVMRPADAKRLLEQVEKKAQASAHRFGGDPKKAALSLALEARNRELTALKYRERARALDVDRMKNYIQPRIQAFVNKGLPVYEALKSLLSGAERDVKGAAIGIQQLTQARSSALFSAFKAEMKGAGLWEKYRGDTLQRDIALEHGRAGDSKNPDAAKIALLEDKYRDKAIALYNDAGGYIEKIEGYNNSQQWSAAQLMALGKQADGSLDANAGFEKFKAIVMPAIDPERTFEGKDPDSVLRGSYDNLRMGDHSKEGEHPISGFVLAGGLADKYSHARTIHFKDAASAYDVMALLGVHSGRSGYFRDLLGLARSSAIMDVLGPNFESNWKKAIHDQIQIAKELPDGKKYLGPVEGPYLNGIFKTVTGQTDQPGNAVWAKTNSNIRSALEVMSLGGAGFSSLVLDPVASVTHAGSVGVSKLDWLGKWITHMSGQTDPVVRAEMSKLGIGNDSLINDNASRAGQHEKASGFMERVKTWFYTWNGLDWVTNKAKMAMADSYLGTLGEAKALPYDKLESHLQRSLRMSDIGPVEWDALRATAVKMGDRDFIRVGQLDALPDAELQKLQDLYGRSGVQSKRILDEKVQALAHDVADHGVPTPGAEEHALATFHGQRAGTWGGEFARYISMFHRFPLTVWNKVVSREMTLHQNGSRSDWVMAMKKGKFDEGFFNLAAWVGLATLAGYTKMCLTAAANGQTRPMFLNEDGTMNVTTYMSAIQVGGAFGPYSDLVATNYRDAGALAANLGGPMVAKVGSMAALVDAALVKPDQGTKWQNIELQGAKFLHGSIPFANALGTKQAFDRLIWWHVENAIDPDALSRDQKALKQRTGQDYLPGWEPRDSGPLSR